MRAVLAQAAAEAPAIELLSDASYAAVNRGRANTALGLSGGDGVAVRLAG